MKTLTALVGVAMVLPVMYGLAADEKAPGLPEAKVAVVSGQAPKIDGALDDAIWQKATVVTDFKTPDGKTPKAKTRLLLAQDADNLYIAVECFETEAGLKNLKADVKDHDGDDIWTDDDVELFIDPAGKRSTYYQIIINPKGATFDAFFETAGSPDKSWDPKYQSAAKVGKESWIVEFAFPWAAFNRTPKLDATWCFNMLRMRPGDGEIVYWSPIEESAHTPDKFGKLTGIAGK